MGWFSGFRVGFGWVLGDFGAGVGWVWGRTLFGASVLCCVDLERLAPPPPEKEPALSTEPVQSNKKDSHFGPCGHQPPT